MIGIVCLVVIQANIPFKPRLIFLSSQSGAWKNQIVLFVFLFNKLNASKNVQVGNDQEKAKSERNSHSKNQDGKNYIEN